MRSYVTGSGDYNVICKVCGWKLKASQARRRWDGLEPVHADTCWEPRHPAEFYKPRNDFHPLPYTSPEPSLVDGMFPSNNLPDEDDTVSVIPSTSDNTYGNRFTCNATGYIESVRFFYWNEVGHESVGDEDPGYVTAPSSPLWVGLWLTDQDTNPLIWSKSDAILYPGKWNTIQVIPNIAVTSGLQYTVGITNGGSYITNLTLAAQQYATRLTTRSHATSNTHPDTSQSVLLLADVKIRKTT